MAKKGSKKSGNKKWIQKAVKRPGRMERWCKRNGYSSVTCECLRKAKAVAKKRGDKSLMSAANLGMRFKKCGKASL